MNKIELQFISTASHGYLKVPFNVLQKYMNHKDISEYSFVDHTKKIFYLEEDCDAPLFMKIVKQKDNIEVYESYLEDLPITTERLFRS